MHDGITKAWKPILETTPAIRAHRSDNLIWWGGTPYSPEDTEKMILDAQLALANLRKRQREQMEFSNSRKRLQHLFRTLDRTDSTCWF